MTPRKSLNRIACSRCKSKKIRCNRVDPRCDKCEAIGAECIYLPRRERASKRRTEVSEKDVISDILRRLERLEDRARSEGTEENEGSCSRSPSLADEGTVESTADQVTPTPFNILDRLKDDRVKSQLCNLSSQLRYTGLSLFEDERFAKALEAAEAETTNSQERQLECPQITKHLAKKWINLFYDTHHFEGFKIPLEKDFLLSIPDLLEIRHVQLDNVSLIIYHNILLQGMLLDLDHIAERGPSVQYLYHTSMKLTEGWLDNIEEDPIDLCAALLMYSMAIESFNSEFAWKIFNKICIIARALGHFSVDAGTTPPEPTTTTGSESEIDKNRKRFEFWHLLRTDCFFRLHFDKPALIPEGTWAVNFPDPSIDGVDDASKRFIQIHFLASMRVTLVLLKYLGLEGRDTGVFDEGVESLAAEVKTIMSSWRAEDLLEFTTHQFDTWVCADILFSCYGILIILYRSKQLGRDPADETVDIARACISTMRSVVNSAPRMYWGTSIILMHQLIPFFTLCSSIIDRGDGDIDSDLGLINWMSDFMEKAEVGRAELRPIRVILKAMNKVCQDQSDSRADSKTQSI